VLKNMLRILVIIQLMIFSVSIMAKTSVELESGIVSAGMSDVRIPGDTGTLFSLTDDLKSETPPFIRIRIIQPVGERHTISLLYAPLTIVSKGKLHKDINFAGTVFPANNNAEAIYKFNSYRITYRYEIVKNLKTEFGLGFTAKIRDAKIELKSAGLKSEKANVGFVPIINFRFHQNLNDKYGLLFEGDALAAPQGRAEDVFLGATYELSESMSFKLGYRILEGGADNDVVYNFALINYAVLGLQYNF
jgi:hypothetical protein